MQSDWWDTGRTSLSSHPDIETQISLLDWLLAMARWQKKSAVGGLRIKQNYLQVGFLQYENYVIFCKKNVSILYRNQELQSSYFS